MSEAIDARVPLLYRDYCAHLVIPLNECRFDNYYLPYKCNHERSAYEKCLFDDHVRRYRIFQEKKKQLALELQNE